MYYPMFAIPFLALVVVILKKVDDKHRTKTNDNRI